MARNCNLELPLVPSAGNDSPHSNSSASRSEEEPTESSQQFTIFYNGHVCVCDLTEIQARAILCLAEREMDQRLAKGSSGPRPQLQLGAPTLSMKRSLQQFLQKRRRRIQESAPYGQ